MFSASKSGQYPGYQISRSVRLRSSASAYFNRTMAPAGVTVYTFSTWVKRGELGTIKPIVQGYLNNNNYGHIIFKADNTIEWREVSVAVNYGQVNTNAVFRDPSAWYHIVVVRNGTSLLIYVNGVSQTLTVSTAVNAAAGYLFGGSTVQRIGSDQVNSAFFDGYLTECYLIDGQALTPASFGSTNATTGVWQPIKYTGTYGTNGFYLNFSDNSGVTATTIGKDYSGNGNNWTPNNISVTAGVTYDSMLDVPTQWADGGNGRGNYAVMNPLDAQGTATLSDANLTLASATTAHKNRKATFLLPSTGKWYWELTTASTCSSTVILGWGLQTTSAASDSQAGNANTWMAQNDANQDIFNQTTSVLSTGSAVAGGSIRQVAYDADTGKLWFGVNNSWYSSTDLTSGNPSAGTNQCMTLSAGDYFPAITCYNLTANANFGQRPFAYTPPSGFKALNTLNLPTPTILKGELYMNATLWSGDSVNARVITTSLTAVDFAWVKKRNGIDDHRLANTVTGGNRHLQSNTTAAESTGTTVIQAFSGSTFTLGTDNSVNATGGTYVGWTWAEGATQGFDIVTYTGTGANRTVAHNLGVAPSFMIVKARSSAGYDWRCYHSALGATKYIDLQTTSAAGTASTVWQDTAPTSSVFSVGTNGSVNANTVTFVAYLFSQITGFSAFGSYTGNGSADGPFVFTGFRPRYVLIKCSSAAGTGWYVYDTVRNTYNVMDLYLRPDVSDAETTFTTLDCLSNGFKLRTTNSQFNGSGSTYIFAAFAENPAKYSLAR